ncbi:alpha/beta hydrolase [Brachybacterium vulturis]|uniref:alpha/beta hydrolase n=1 Tax=Brachybacterium vulturis TaxID=2017484 RepID=UPI0037368B71
MSPTHARGADPSAPTTETRVQVPVDGGLLTGTLWRAGAPGTPVVAIHGITANHRSFSGLALRLDAPVLAMDLRGRGASRHLPGPYAMTRHAEDVAAMMRGAGIERAVIVGHSMGAFVAVRLAAAHPELVERLVLVDGGLPLKPTPAAADLSPEDVLGPAIQRLSKTFDSAAEYRQFWREHPALGPYWNRGIEEYVDADLALVDGRLRPSAIPDAVTTNLIELDGRDGYTEQLEGLEVAMTVLRSPRGLFDEVPALYDPEWFASWRATLPGMATVEVPDTNHYTILMGSGVDAVAEAVRLLPATTAPSEEIRP